MGKLNRQTENILTEYEAVRQHIAELAAIGETYLKEEYKSQYTQMQKAGMAIGYNGYGSRDVADLAYHAWEEMNAHGANTILNWMYKMYGTYERELETVSRLMGGVRDIKYYDEAAQEWKTKRVKCTVMFEDVVE